MMVGQFIERAKGCEDYERMCRMKDERHETIEQSVTDCNHLGNAAKMREALSRILGIADHLQTRFAIPKLASEEISELKQIAESALSTPPRNCDVGTVEEQAERFHAFCASNKKCGDVYSCERCQFNSVEDCELAWAQMPYEEGGAK